MGIILETLVDYGKQTSVRPKNSLSRLEYAQSCLKAESNMPKKWFRRKDYLSIHPDISMPTASRDLIFGVKQKILVSTGQKNQVQYRFVVE